MITFNCPQCNKKIEVDDRYAGHTGKCQHCGTAITVPTIQEQQATGLDSLRAAPDVADPANFGAYAKAADAHWVDPADIAEQAAMKRAEEALAALPDVPAEILAAAKARKRQSMQYIIGAALAALIIVVLLLPLLMPKPKGEAKKDTAPVPAFGEKQDSKQ